MKTSLLLLVFNGESLINRALQSVYNQSKKIDEVVVINDASNDNTYKIVNKWSDKLPIKQIINKTNIGIFRSLKQGVEICSGSLIFRIDHDDEWMKNHVEEIINLYNQNKNATLYATRAIYLDKNSMFLKNSQTISNKNIRKKLLWDNPLVQSSVAFFKKDFLKVYSKSQMFSTEDYDLWIKLLKLGDLNFSSEPTVHYFVYENSLSRRNIKRNYNERFLCQREALKSFFNLYPLRSLIISFILLARLTYRFLRRI